MADMKGLSGSIVALVTPFAEDGSVDFGALGRLVDFHLENGTDALLTLGTTGESSTMSHEEDDEVCKFVVDRVAGRVPVIAGSGSNSTQTMLEKSLGFQKMGADGLLLITPYYNKSNEEGIYRHFTTVLDAVDIPCILYNVPGRTGCSISEKNVARLAKHPNAFGIKEASGNIGYATKIARYLSGVGQPRRYFGLGECAAEGSARHVPRVARGRSCRRVENPACGHRAGRFAVLRSESHSGEIRAGAYGLWQGGISPAAVRAERRGEGDDCRCHEECRHYLAQPPLSVVEGKRT